MEKDKAKKAIQKGNMEVARIHAENAIRQKNQAINYLRMSARVDAVSSRVQTALTTRKVNFFVTSLFPEFLKVKEYQVIRIKEENIIQKLIKYNKSSW